MPDGSSHLLFSLVVLVFLSAFFSATETAYSCLSRIKLKTLFLGGNRLAGKVLEFAESKYDRLLSTILIGNNIVNLSASAIATLFFAKLLYGTKVDSTVVSTAVMTVCVLLFGEITPKYIAKAYPERLAMLFYPIIKFVYYVFIPLNVFFIGWKNLISRIFKLDKEDVITEDEIITFVKEAQDDGTLRQDETKLIRSVIDFDDLEARDVLTPRVQIAAVRSGDSVDDVRKAFVESGFSRLPVYDDSLDSIIGILHMKDFYSKSDSVSCVADMVQPAFFTPEHTKISKLLKTFQKNRGHMAVVLDEYGGTLGIITMEDILEEIVGEILDEHDSEIASFKKLGDGSFEFAGDMMIEKVLSMLGVEDDSIVHESNTLSGWILEILGEIPSVGKKFSRDGLCVEVLASDTKRVSKAKVSLEKAEAVS